MSPRDDGRGKVEQVEPSDLAPALAPPADVLDYTALIKAYLAREACEGADRDLAKYHRRLFDALSRAFGIRLDQAPAGLRLAEQGLHRLFIRTAERHNAVSMAFEGYLEMPAYMRPVLKKHGPRQRQLADETRAALFELLCDLFDLLWGPQTKTVTVAELAAQGVDLTARPERDVD